MKYFHLSVTFLNGTYHGRADNGAPEWPPAPMRIYQALLASAAARRQLVLPDRIAAALDWLAGQPPPVIVAPPHQTATPYQTSVPNNAMDIVARAWSRGGDSGKDAQPATHKAMKTIRPTYLVAGAPEEQRVSYLWQIDKPDDRGMGQHTAVLAQLASQLVAVGWGLDLVAGHGEVISLDDAQRLKGERWTPQPPSGPALRAPNGSTRRCLENRHESFLQRLSGGTLNPVPSIPPTAFDSFSYRRDWEPAVVPIAGFGLLEIDGSGFRPFSMLKGCEVAGMLRFAAASAARNTGWTDERVARFILGHGEPAGNAKHEPVGQSRFAYIPLPSLEKRSSDGPASHVGMIRRGLIYVPANGYQAEIDWARRTLTGGELVREHSGESEALLSLIPQSDKMVRRYVPREGAATWATVTPMVLPGNVDRKLDLQRLRDCKDAARTRELVLKREQRIDGLIRRAIVQAGLPQALADHAVMDWRKVGYWPGAERVGRYFIPKHLRKFPAYHVRIVWCDPEGRKLAIPGPLVLGGGRFCGLGLFAQEIGDHQTT